jgi:hypothetical protein
LKDHTTSCIQNCISKKLILFRIYDFVYSTYLAAATAPTWGPTATATTAAATGPALSAAASGFLREILMDLGLEPAVAAAVAAAFLWGELMAKALALAAGPWSPTGEAVLPANADVAMVTGTATALEDAWHLCLEAALAAAAANAFLLGGTDGQGNGTGGGTVVSNWGGGIAFAYKWRLGGGNWDSHCIGGCLVAGGHANNASNRECCHHAD